MSKFSERAAAALELLPEELQERAVTFLLDEADKLQALRDAVALGMADVEAGRVIDWDVSRYTKVVDDIEAAKNAK